MSNWKGGIMKYFTKKELLSVPNCMGYFRIFLIPVFCVFYLTADSVRGEYVAAAVLVISSITDFLDGKIARHFHMVTEFGKFLDPVADKLTHAAIAVCLSFRYPLMRYLIILMIIKEGFMAGMGAWNLKFGQKLDGAKWFGKVCTASLFLLLLTLVVFPWIPKKTADFFILAEMIIMFLTLILYIPEFQKMKKKRNRENNRKHIN